MNIQEFPISGLKLIQLKAFRDERGFFTERYHQLKMSEVGLPSFVQDNFSRSASKVLRGLHFQHSPSQGKLVSCTRGKIFDVAVDLRKDSPTFGKYANVVLSGDDPALFWIPAGFAHGFCVLGTEEADVLYKVDSFYSPQTEAGIAWNDRELNIDWPLTNPILSAKDSVAMSFSQFKENPKF